MVEQVERTTRNFLFLNDGNFEVRNVTALSSTSGNTDVWFVEGEGVCTIGISIFENMHDVRKRAKEILKQKQNVLDTLQEKYESMIKSD